MTSAAPKKRSPLKSLIFTLVKILIAFGGLYWVISHTPWHNSATLRAGTQIRGVVFLDNTPVTLLDRPLLDRPVRDPSTSSSTDPSPRRNLLDTTTPTTSPRAYWIRFGSQKIKVQLPEGPRTLTTIINEDTVGIPNETPINAADLLTVEDTGTPKIQIGLRNLIKNADLKLLLASWALLCVPFFVSAWRWRKLMQPQGIFLPFKKCLALTFVGQFYSTFLPGITGGDLVKIIYTARVTGSKTKSTITILLDRIIGLIALIVIAGIAAAFQSRHNHVMFLVTIGIGASLLGLVVFSVIYFSHRLRKATGLEWLLNHNRMPDFVRKADEVLHAYRGAWRILAMAFAASLITQILVPLSAYLAGRAFGIQAHPGYYLSYVPLAILAASVPISPPQGFGVTEWILFKLFTATGLATAAQTFALAQAIRFLPIAWNLIGAYWVLTGSYSRHQAQAEEAALDAQQNPANPTPLHPTN